MTARLMDLLLALLPGALGTVAFAFLWRRAEAARDKALARVNLLEGETALAYRALADGEAARLDQAARHRDAIVGVLDHAKECRDDLESIAKAVGHDSPGLRDSLRDLADRMSRPVAVPRARSPSHPGAVPATTPPNGRSKS